METWEISVEQRQQLVDNGQRTTVDGQWAKDNTAVGHRTPDTRQQVLTMDTSHDEHQHPD